MSLNPTLDPIFIVNAAKVTSIYGGWPTFHDSEVLSVAIDREGPTLTVRVWTFKVHRNETDARGYYKMSDRSVVLFRFLNFEELSIEGFNIQNVLSAIVFERIDQGVRVNMDGIFGASITFRCATVIVDEVERCE